MTKVSERFEHCYIWLGHNLVLWLKRTGDVYCNNKIKEHSTKKPVTTMLTYPWKCTVLHCNHLGNTDYCPSSAEGKNKTMTTKDTHLESITHCNKIGGWTKPQAMCLWSGLNKNQWNKLWRLIIIVIIKGFIKPNIQHISLWLLLEPWYNNAVQYTLQ